jgi:hypothetical protein
MEIIWGIDFKVTTTMYTTKLFCFRHLIAPFLLCRLELIKKEGLLFAFSETAFKFELSTKLKLENQRTPEEKDEPKGYAFPLVSNSCNLSAIFLYLHACIIIKFNSNFLLVLLWS